MFLCVCVCVCVCVRERERERERDTHTHIPSRWVNRPFEDSSSHVLYPQWSSTTPGQCLVFSSPAGQWLLCSSGQLEKSGVFTLTWNSEGIRFCEEHTKNKKHNRKALLNGDTKQDVCGKYIRLRFTEGKSLLQSFLNGFKRQMQ